MNLNRDKPYRRFLRMGLITLTLLFIVITSLYFILKQWEEELIQEQKGVCERRAANIARLVESDSEIQKLIALLLHGDTLNLASSRVIEETLAEMMKRELDDTEGLEGGFYILGLDDFIGYAYPTSKPPIPAYGPPPRSYDIIKDQVLASISNKEALTDLHKFDPAVFPLATVPIRISGRIAGAVWIRIHIERDLPVAKLRQVLYLVTVVFGVGFLIMALLTLFLRSGIRSIQKELVSTRTDPGYRLKLRGGLFGFIPKRINEMLDLIETEYNQRLELEKKLQHKDKLVTLGKMIAGVAHEVRTPLSVIKTRLQIWETATGQKKEPATDIHADTLRTLISEIDRISDLMKRLLVFSRPIYDHMKPTSINTIIEEVLSMMEFSGSGKEIRITKRFHESPLLVNSDPNSLKQVIINIIHNAVESLDTGGEILTETLFDPAERLATVKISDNGTGIEEEVMKHIFDPFYTTKETGTGLGLAISQEIIISHGGKISFRKNEPRGTICFITLPLINPST